MSDVATIRLPLRVAAVDPAPEAVSAASVSPATRHLPDVEGDKPKRQRFRRYPIGLFHIDIAEGQTADIDHRLTKPNHPWTNGQVERMNRTIKEAPVKRFHYDGHDQLRTHLAGFMLAYNFARRLKTLSGLTPYEYIAKIWTSEPDRFIVNPIHQMPGPNT